jgi:hypothetical protein
MAYRHKYLKTTNLNTIYFNLSKERNTRSSLHHELGVIFLVLNYLENPLSFVLAHLKSFHKMCVANCFPFCVNSASISKWDNEVVERWRPIQVFDIFIVHLYARHCRVPLHFWVPRYDTIKHQTFCVVKSVRFTNSVLDFC